jgi:hypothetical protein
VALCTLKVSYFVAMTCSRRNLAAALVPVLLATSASDGTACSSGIISYLMLCFTSAHNALYWESLLSQTGKRSRRAPPGNLCRVLKLAKKPIAESVEGQRHLVTVTMPQPDPPCHSQHACYCANHLSTVPTNLLFMVRSHKTVV